jgi:hypothetical protein
VLLAVLVTSLLYPDSAPAQRKKLEDEAYVAEKPTIGDKFPDVIVYTPDGKEVRTSDWKGHYAVLTFGCLT